MTNPDTQQYRDQLLSLKSELQGTAASSREAAGIVELDQTRVGRISRIDAMQRQQMAQEADRRRQRQILLIDAALRRIEAGTFGICSSCEEKIDPRRLRADPTVTMCVPCASQKK